MSSKFTDLWQLMSQYRFEVDPDSGNDDLICLLCKNVLVDACQTVCGCQYCHKCISDYLTEGDKYCPGGKDECKEEYLVMERDVIKNIRMNSRISKLLVKCPNELCQVKTELVKMEDHLRICTMHNSVCPYASMGCDKLQNHKYNDPFLHSQILIDSINNLKNEVDGLTEKLETNERENKMVEEKSRMDTREMIEEVAKQRREILALKEDVKNKTNRMTYLEKELRSRDKIVRTLDEKFNKMNNELEIKLSRMTLQITQREEDFKELKDFYGKIDNNMITLRETLDDGETSEQLSQSDWSSVEVLTNGFDFKWIVDKLSTRRKTLYSDPFHSNGYKLCLSFHPSWTGIYIWCYIMKGSNDDKVQWPMRHTVALSIINQITLKSQRTLTFQHDTYQYAYRVAFARPIGVRNDYSIGSTSMILYSAIKNAEQVFANDSIMIGCALINNSH